MGRLLELVRRKRPHAGFFDWPDRQEAERFVVHTYSDAARAVGELGLNSIVSVRPDPPDCEAVGPFGERVGVEVTEFVDQRLAGQRPMRTRPKFWEIDAVVARLQTTIDRKGRRCRGVTSYDKLILLNHTDEMFLRGYPGDEIREGVRAASFRPAAKIDEVIFLFSYDARVRSYPWIRLSLNEAG